MFIIRNYLIILMILLIFNLYQIFREKEKTIFIKFTKIVIAYEIVAVIIVALLYYSDLTSVVMNDRFWLILLVPIIQSFWWWYGWLFGEVK